MNKPFVWPMIVAAFTVFAISSSLVPTVSKADEIPSNVPATRPKIIGNVMVEYPDIARKNRWEGRAIVLHQINESGELENISVEKSSGHTELDDAALAAFRNVRFEPAIKDGKPVLGTIRYPITFSMN
jgi:periplasmic protein TonB